MCNSLKHHRGKAPAHLITPMIHLHSATWKLEFVRGDCVIVPVLYLKDARVLMWCQYYNYFVDKVSDQL